MKFVRVLLPLLGLRQHALVGCGGPFVLLERRTRVVSLLQQSRPEEQLIGHGILRQSAVDKRLLTRGQRGLQRRRHLARNRGLHREHVVQFGVELVAPELAAGLRVNQLHRDAHLFARALHTAFHDRSHAKVGRDLSEVALLHVGIGQHRGAADDGKRRDFPHCGDHLAMNPVGEISAVRLRTEILERQHGDGFGVGGRSGFLRGWQARASVRIRGLAREKQRRRNRDDHDRGHQCRRRDAATHLRWRRGALAAQNGARAPRLHLRATQQFLHPLDKSRRRFATTKLCPLHRNKRFRHQRAALGRPVNRHRQNKRRALGHQVRALVCEFPFEPEISLAPRLRRHRNYRQEECARRDLAADFSIPRIPADKFALVEPDLDASGP